MSTVIGIKMNGERIPFETWVFNNWRCGTLRDPFLLAHLRACVRFERWY